MLDLPYEVILIIGDGAAFGPEIERALSLRKLKRGILYLPESFEWLVLKADLLRSGEIREILRNPSDHIESRDYFSWERYFTRLLTERATGTYLQYSKAELNPVYLQQHETDAIMAQLPDLQISAEWAWSVSSRAKMPFWNKTRSKSERRGFGALLERVFHIRFALSKGMPFGA